MPEAINKLGYQKPTTEQKAMCDLAVAGCHNLVRLHPSHPAYGSSLQRIKEMYEWGANRAQAESAQS